MSLRVRRTILLVALLAVYLATALRGVVGELARRGQFDPFLPLARAVEQRVEEQRFSEALPLATDLRRTYPREPQLAYWLARIQQGLHDTPREIEAWEDYVRLSTDPADACSALPDAYDRIGRASDALRAYQHCASLDSSDSDRLIDLGDAYARNGRARDALREFERAQALDSGNPFLADRMRRQREADR